MNHLSGHPARPPNTNVQHVSDLQSSPDSRYVRLFTEANASLSLTIRDGKATLAPSDPNDPHQQWVKDERFAEVKDGDGFPSFALVNKATGQAINNSVGAGQPVRLITYVPDILDKSVLWTLGVDLGDGYRAVRMLNNTSLNLDAFNTNNEGVHDGTIIGLWEWLQGGNQRWKIVPHDYVPTVRVFTKANTNCSLAIRNGKVILAQADQSDLSQHWVKNSKDTTLIKDEQGFPSFVLVNEATGQAMKHSVGAGQPVELIPYVPGIQNLNESFLWSLGLELGDGYRAMRMVNNTSLNLDAFNTSNEGVHDGTIIGLWEWTQGDNQQWKIVAY